MSQASRKQDMTETPIKCVVWDLDNTIWDGVLLEDPTVTLKPGIRDIIIELDRRGILHSIASRNNTEDALQKLTEFGLAEYFLYPEIGWDVKSRSLARIVETLNIGMDAVLFIDDQPFERDEVASQHPEIWCLDSVAYRTLTQHPRLNPKYITEDSARRRTMYLADIQRKQDEDAFVGPSQAFLRQLEMIFDIDEAKEHDLLRAEELTYRTNQLNATGRRYTVEMLRDMLASGSHRILVCELTDRYGSYGKIGMAVLRITDATWSLELLLFSCRVMSKGVGTVFLTCLRNAARQNGVRLLADFKETERNRAMFITYSFAGFREIEKDNNGMILMENDLQEMPPLPDHLTLNINVDWSAL
jgi:FkbH-like protein